MKVAIAEVGLDSMEHLFVRPPEFEDFTYIWRDASGVRWDQDRHVLIAYEPERWEPVTLFKQIVAVVNNEYGRELEVTLSTEWSNVQPKLRAQIEAAS